MKVFISWSGEFSHRVALVLRDWLPSVIQIIEPYVSSEDIDKGARWSTDISKELEESSYGILCVTKDNLEAPWLNFEAGALSKSFDKSRVSPFLFGVKRSEVKGPVLQFQSTIYEKDDIKKLLSSINSACDTGGLDEARLEAVFNVWWPKLEEDLNALLKEQPTPPEQDDKTESATSESSEILEEILDLVRSQQKILNDPEQLLPPQYVSSVVRRSQRYLHSSPVMRDLKVHWEELNELADSYADEELIPTSAVIDKVRRMAKPVEYMLDRGVTRRSPSLFSSRRRLLDEEP